MARSKYREVPIVPLSCFSVRSWSNSEIWILGRLGPKSLDPNGEDWWYSTEWGHALCRYYMDVIWILYGYYMDIIWIWYAYYMDVIWILYAYYMDVIWILYAYYMDIICFCIVKNVMAQVPLFPAGEIVKSLQHHLTILCHLQIGCRRCRKVQLAISMLRSAWYTWFNHGL